MILRYGKTVFITLQKKSLNKMLLVFIADKFCVIVQYLQQVLYCHTFLFRRIWTWDNLIRLLIVEQVR